MPFWRWHGRTFARKALFLWTVTILSVAQNAPTGASPAAPPKHFDHVLIVVLENQDYESAIRNDLLKSLAQKGAIFSNFGNLYHYSYPNYLAMIAGSDFGRHKPLLFSDNQRTFSDDSEHRTIAGYRHARFPLVERNHAPRFRQAGYLGPEMPAGSSLRFPFTPLAGMPIEHGLPSKRFADRRVAAPSFVIRCWGVEFAMCSSAAPGA
jgi:hypothetical protein